MSWTEIQMTVHVDGPRENALGVAADLLELIGNDPRVIALSAELGKEHDDTCDDEPCTCGATA